MTAGIAATHVQRRCGGRGGQGQARCMHATEAARPDRNATGASCHAGTDSATGFRAVRWQIGRNYRAGGRANTRAAGCTRAGPFRAASPSSPLDTRHRCAYRVTERRRCRKGIQLGCARTRGETIGSDARLQFPSHLRMRLRQQQGCVRTGRMTARPGRAPGRGRTAGRSLHVGLLMQQLRR